MADIVNNNSNSLVSGTSGDDYIKNEGNDVTIVAGAGNDNIYNRGVHPTVTSASVGSYASINCGEGNDSVWNSGRFSVIDGGDGNDTLTNSDYGLYSTFKGGNGNDFISTYNDNSVSIDGGEGNDTLDARGTAKGVTITGGKGNDSIKLNGGNNLVQYNAGDGNDIILGFSTTDSLQIIGGKSFYSKTVSGNNIIVATTNGTITLSGAASLTSVNILGSYFNPINSNVANTVVNGTSGNDSITNTSASVKVDGGEGIDIIRNYKGGSKVTISGGNDNDSIENYGISVSIDGGAGNDNILNREKTTFSVTINGGAGKDTIWNYYYSSLTAIDGGADDDFIGNYSSNSTLRGGDGNDTIRNRSTGYSYNNIPQTGGGKNVTIEGGKGNDSIRNEDSENVLFKYTAGDGNDTISGFNETSTLQIDEGKGAYSTTKSGNNIIVTIKDSNRNVNGTVTLLGAEALSKVNISGNYLNPIKSSVADTIVIGTSSNDSILNSVNNVTINANAGNDYVWNSSATSSVKIDGGDGNDEIHTRGKNATLRGGKGNDSLYGNYWSENILADGGADNDYIWNWSDYSSLFGGDGDDTIYNTENAIYNNERLYGKGKNVTISGGKGDDSIRNNGGEKVLFKYKAGDGNDTITGFNSTSTLSIGEGKGSYSTTASGNDVIVKVGKGKITLSGAATLEAVNIVGKELPVWKLNGKTATYGTSGKTLVKVKGVKSLDGISLKDKVVTVKKSSLGTSKVTISGTGYTLKLGSDVSVPLTSKDWIRSGTTAFYNQTTSAGYTLAKDGKSISYSKATSAKSLATVKGTKSTKGLTVSGKKITLKNTALSSEVTVSGKYEFDFASDYKKATIIGSSSTDSITTRGKNLYISVGKGNDTVKVFGSATTVKGGAGKDVFIYKSGGANVISDYAAEDEISIASGIAKVTSSGSDVILTAGKCTITVENGNDKTVTYFDAGGKKTYTSPVNINGETIYLLKSYLNETFDVAKYGKAIQTIDASAVVRNLKITGNDLANKIIGGPDDDTIDGNKGADTISGGKGNDSMFGGKGNDSLYGGNGNDILVGGVGNDTLIGGKNNDTLTGGEGSDIFIYKKGDGNDLITDYAEEDAIKIKGDAVSKISMGSNKKDIILTLSGKKTITITDGAGKVINYSDKTGEHVYPDPLKFNSKGTAVTIRSTYEKETFNLAEYKNAVVTINASEVTHSMNIIGNDEANSILGTANDDTVDGGNSKDIIRSGEGNDSIFGGKGNDTLYGGIGSDTLWGGAGNDYLYGGEGADVFVYDSGDGTDKIFDYDSAVDKIMILSGDKPILSDNPLSNDATFTVGNGKIVVENGAGKNISFIGGNGKSI